MIPKKRKHDNSEPPQPEQTANSLKHGIYSAMPLLPGENAKEFEELVQSTWDEWQPEGATEKETVMALAIYHWRKSRLDVFKKIQDAKDHNDEFWTLLSSVINAAESYTGRPAEFRKYAEENKTLAPIIARLTSVFGTNVLTSLTVLKKKHEAFKTICDAFGLDVKEALPEALPTSRMKFEGLADVITAENFATELAVRERLEGLIDRCIKRLIQLKLAKRMLQIPKALPEPERHPRPKLRSV